MQRKQLETAAANYPYLQGLWALPMGFLIILTGFSNLEDGPSQPVILAILGAGLLLCWAACVAIARYYRNNYGEVTPTKQRQTRNIIAVVAWAATLFAVASRFTFWSADSPLCIYAVAFALATLVYYAILVGLKAHHILIWGAVLAAGLLPIWGSFGSDRDAVAMFPLGLALMLSGLLDQRLLARSFRRSASSAEDNVVGE